MIEWKLMEKYSRNPELIKTVRNISHPLIRKPKYMFPQKKIKILYKPFQLILFKQMDIGNQELIYCADDGDY